MYGLPDIVRLIKSRRLRWAGHVVRMGESRAAYRVLTGFPEGRRPVGGPRRRWSDNVMRDLAEIGCCNGDWVVNAQDRVACRCDDEISSS